MLKEANRSCSDFFQLCELSWSVSISSIDIDKRSVGELDDVLAVVFVVFIVVVVAVVVVVVVVSAAEGDGGSSKYFARSEMATVSGLW